MLSAFERRQANEDNTLWRQNAAIIRQLYQDERKTLKEVKAIMENEKGFPVTPLPTWEVKLRELGIQKKLKAKDWSLIYQHISPRLHHQGKKEFRKPTVVLVHGMEKPWDKCWKEIRRNRALIQRHHKGPLPPLPSFITVRTPTPELLETIVQRQPPKDVHFLVQQLFQTTVVSLQPLFELGLSSLNEKSHISMCPTPDSVYKLCLQGIPFTTLLDQASGLPFSPHAVVGPEASHFCDNRSIPSSGHPGNLAISGCTSLPKFQFSSIYSGLLSESTYASPAGQQVGLNFDGHHYLSMVIYLLSNNIVSWAPPLSDEVSLSDVLQMTLEFVSKQVLAALFQSQLLSIKAGWERLLICAQELQNKEAFEFFINIGIQNEWLEIHDKGHEYLYSAAQMNCSEILGALIDRGCQMNLYPSWCYGSWKSTLVETINNGNLDCARLLVQNCDVNHEFRVNFGDSRSTHFAMFIMAFDDTRLDHLNCLKFLLENGADVDYKFQDHTLHTKHYNSNVWLWWREGQEELEKDWPLSILDCVYYYHRTLFLELLPYSSSTAQFSRAIALWNLEQGVDAFRKYLNIANPCEGDVNHSTSDPNSPRRKDHCLEILLAEQFLLSIILRDKNVWWRRVSALSKLEINLMHLRKTEKTPIIMLCATACFATSEKEQHKQTGLQIMQWLLDRGLQVNSDALMAAYRHGGVTVMQYLASFCNDIKIDGGKTLVEAILKSDLSSAQLLLHLGVDPNSNMIATKRWDMNVFEAAAWGSTLAMMKYLVQRGVKPRIGKCGDRPSLALVHIFLSPHVDEMFNKVQYIVEEHMMIYEPLWPSRPLLERCLFGGDRLDVRRRIFEYLLKKGAGLNIGSPLAQWIGTGGGHQLVQQMLSAGADPNAYSHTKLDPDFNSSFGPQRTPLQAAAGIGDYTLVCLLLDHGADVNAPALQEGRDERTALQAICIWNPVRREERLRKGQIVQLLLDKGADANLANLAGYTALMEAAYLGDISTAFTLLKYGATPNAISKETSYGQSTALDIAAQLGRLDMVKFLLNANALSSTAWSNGEDYEGAIQMARREGHSVISQLIRIHSAERHRWNVPSETSIATSLNPEHTRQWLSLRTTTATPIRPQSRSHPAARKSPSSTTALDQTDTPSNTLEEDELSSSHGVSKAKSKGTTTTGVTDASSLSDVEDIEPRMPLGEAGCDEPRGARTDETADQDSETEETISGSASDVWLYEPRGQSWTKEDQRSADLLAPTSLAEDVFMGFPGIQSL